MATRIGYWDAFSGISGDMTIGALVDAGVGMDELRAALDSLGTGAVFHADKVRRKGITATHFRVEFERQHKHRHLPHILDMIEKSQLPALAKQNAAAVFRKLGEAEATVHGVPIEKVHFHEVGAVDSICDIAGACFGLAWLGVEEIHCSAINTGSGTVNTEHGVLPVPAPATARLLTDVPVYASGPEMELTTPTGAALAVTLAARFGPMPAMRIQSIGYGAGTKDVPVQANVLRFTVGTRTGAAEATTVSVLEANIDDCSPQVLGYAMERLLEAGALDVTLTPLLMKKNRPGSLLRVIATPEMQEQMAGLMFAETPTLGLRIHKAERRVQAREIVEVETAHGKVRVKVSGEGWFAPEYEDCRKAAIEAGVPLRQVIGAACLAYQRLSK